MSDGQFVFGAGVGPGYAPVGARVFYTDEDGIEHEAIPDADGVCHIPKHGGPVRIESVGGGGGGGSGGTIPSSVLGNGGNGASSIIPPIDPREGS